jgi:hypothetical protein
MSCTRRRTYLGDELETRALLSSARSIWSNPAIQADLQKIQTDQKALQAEVKTLAPTIQADQKAIQTAIQSAIKNDSSVQTAQATLKADEATAHTTLSNDWNAIWTAPSFSARVAAIKVYVSDATAAAKTIGADAQAVQAAINADAGVVAAKAQLATDEAPIVADQMTLQAYYTQLEKDVQAALKPSGT